MTPESSFKKSLKSRWDKSYPKTNKTADWTAIPGVKGIPDVHISISGGSAWLELKVYPNDLNKNQKIRVPTLSYGCKMFVITQYKSPVDWRHDKINIVQWIAGEKFMIAEQIGWDVISQPDFWEKLVHGQL